MALLPQICIYMLVGHEKLKDLQLSPYFPQSCVMGVVVPDEMYLEAWAPKNGFPKDIKEFCKSKVGIVWVIWLFAYF